MRYREKFTLVVGASGVADASLDLNGVDYEKRHLLEVGLITSAQVADGIEFWLNRDKVSDVYDYHLATIEASGTNNYKDTNRQASWSVDVELGDGDTFAVKGTSGGTGSTVYGYYEYEVV